MKKIYVAANGCAVLRHETNRILTFFLRNGYRESNYIKESNVILFSGCGMTNEDVSFDVQKIEEYQAQRQEHSMFIVTGCLPAVYNKIRDISTDIIVLRYEDLDKLDDILSASIKIREVCYNHGLDSHLVWPKQMDPKDISEDKLLITEIGNYTNNNDLIELYNYSTPGKYIWPDAEIFQIRIAYGCSYKCSYCASRLSVGKMRSVPLQTILNQFQDGIARGFKKFMLIGTELGNYGVDCQCTIVDLITNLYRINCDVKVGIRYIHPDCLVKYFDGLKPFFSNGFVYYFCSAIQTCSSRLLQKMNRNPDLSNFFKCIQIINDNNFPVFKHTQLIVGFPSETFKEIVDTLDIVTKYNFNYVNVNKFSSRPMTPAHQMEEQLSEEEKEKRLVFAKQWLSLKRKDLLYTAIKGLKFRSK